MKKIVLKYLSMAAILLSAVSCMADREGLNEGRSDKVRLSLSVGIDGMPATRAGANNDHEISDGTLANYLIYALYEKETGEIVQIPNAKGEFVERIAGEVKFPHPITIYIERGKKYKMVFWAQCGDKNPYYDTQDLKAIQVYYNRDGSNLNNDEARDAFCASVEIDESTTDDVVLHRPFAQINIGVSQKAWDALRASKVYIKKSEIQVHHVAWKFNLVENEVMTPNDVDGDTQGFKSAALAANTIPYDMYESHPMLKIKEGEDTKDYYWLSMCYVLAGGGETTSSLVDVTDIKFYYGNSEDETNEDMEILTPSFLGLNEVPVRRNWRTNILFDNGLTGTATIHLDLNKNYDDDFNSPDWGETWDGRIANGVSVKSYKNIADPPSDKQSQYKSFWLDFNVSSAEGLKWIARRSNGTPFTKDDIPTWTTKEGEETTYYKFMKDGKPDLDAYKKAVFEVIEGHALIANYAKVLSDVDKPWTFDDAAIILTNDIDFKGETWTEPISTTYTNNKVSSQPGAISPDMNNPFKGTFDGYGYTIKNVVLDCKQYDVGEVRHEGAGLIGAASGRTVVKNLRLYNVKVIGDWNIGGIIGFYGSGDELTIQNVKIENCDLNAVSGSNVNGDSNLGGLVGSLQGKKRSIIENCQILNTTLNSAYLVGSLVGALGDNSARITDCTLNSVFMVLSDYNDIGNYKDFNLNNRTNDPDHPEYALLFGNNIAGAPRNNLDMDMDKVTLTNVGLGIFAADNKWNTSGLDGIGSVQDLPLNLFPVLEARYGRGITLLSHITGTPSYHSNNFDLGLYVDMATAISTDFREGDEQYYRFTIAGERKETDGDATTTNDRLFTLNVKPGTNTTGTNTTYGIGFIGEAEHNPTATVKDLIISGTPMIDGGIYLDNIKNVVLHNIAIYNVANTLVDTNVPENATLTVTNCDLRGDTEYGNYESAIFTNTAFYVGTGDSTENKFCKPGCSTTFDGCHFRTGFAFEVGAGVTLTFNKCYYGEAGAEELITAANVTEFLGIDPKHCTFAE